MDWSLLNRSCNANELFSPKTITYQEYYEQNNEKK